MFNGILRIHAVLTLATGREHRAQKHFPSNKIICLPRRESNTLVSIIQYVGATQ